MPVPTTIEVLRAKIGDPADGSGNPVPASTTPILDDDMLTYFHDLHSEDGSGRLLLAAADALEAKAARLITFSLNISIGGTFVNDARRLSEECRKLAREYRDQAMSQDAMVDYAELSFPPFNPGWIIENSYLRSGL
jgi:hypothetical protein